MLLSTHFSSNSSKKKRQNSKKKKTPKQLLMLKNPHKWTQLGPYKGVNKTFVFKGLETGACMQRNSSTVQVFFSSDF